MTSYSTTSEWSSDRNEQVQFRNTQTQHYLQTVSQIIYFRTEINLPNLLFPSSWPYLKLILPCWFEFWLDYHVNSVERKWNEQQLSSQASPSGGRSEHETCNKMEEFPFDSIRCLPTSISMLENLKLEKNFMQNKSLIIPEINLLLNWERQCNCESFSLWISWPIFLSHAGERLT